MTTSSKQRGKIMENIKQEQVEAITEHMKKFVFTVQNAMKDFILPLDPTEGEEEMEYVQSVVYAVDNLVATTLMVKDDEIAMKALELSSNILIQQLIDHHTKDNVKH